MGGDPPRHNTVWQRAEDPARTGRGHLRLRPDAADLRPVIEGADLAICHEEVPFARRERRCRNYRCSRRRPRSRRGSPRWAGTPAPPRPTTPLDQGFEGLGPHGLAARVRGCAGTSAPSEPRANAASPVAPGRLQAASGSGWWPGTYGLNGFPLPEGREWSVSMLNVPRPPAARPWARSAGRCRCGGRAPARRLRVRRAPRTPSRSSAVKRLTSVAAGRPGARRARAHRPADQEGEREVGRLRDGQPGRAAGGHPAGDVPRDHRAVRLRRAGRRRIRGSPRGVRAGRLEQRRRRPDPGPRPGRPRGRGGPRRRRGRRERSRRTPGLHAD